jgi:capsular exopolysaccharide synthesis family protein
VAIAYAASYFYLRYTTFEYSARAVLLIKDTGKSGGISEQDIISASGGLSGGKSMDNEIQILKSLSLLEKVVEELGLQVSYYRIGQIKETELYNYSPILLDSFELLDPEFYSYSFFVEMKDYESFTLKKSEDDEEGRKILYNESFETNRGKFKLRLNPEVAVIPGLYRVRIRSKESGAYKLRGKMAVKRIGDQSSSSVLELSYMDPVAEKAKDILNTAIQKYNEEEIKDENRVFENTLKFIDNRISDLVIELDSVEGGIQRYKSSNEIINSSAAASMNYTLGEIRGAIQRMSQYEVEQNVLESLERFITSQKDNTALIPANLNATEPALSGLVADYNRLVLENNKLAGTASELNPSRSNVLNQIAVIRNLILSTIQNLKSDLKIPMAEIEENIKDLRRSISNIPGIEKRLIEKMRMQEVKEELFLFLLQKKEETALSEAVTTAKTRTIDWARTSKIPVYPRSKTVYSSGIAIGLILPTLFILALTLFENKIESVEMIKQYTKIPILGTIGKNKSGQSIVVKTGSRSAINEMFRLIRTNLNFINQGRKNQVYMVSSTFSGEGKTFVALNLGLTLALADKKVVILGLDLRKPKLRTYLNGHESHPGISNYLISQSPLEEVLQVYKEIPNLHYITSGPIPPNPAELIMGQKMEELIEILKEQYDYVIIDTPPLGLVSDALLLRKLVNNILIIVRYKLTRKGMIKNLDEMYTNGELENANIIFNGVKKGKGYYGYGGYRYGGKSGYYVEE